MITNQAQIGVMMKERTQNSITPVFTLEKPVYTCFTPDTFVDWTRYGGICEEVCRPNYPIFGNRFQKPFYYEIPGQNIVVVQSQTRLSCAGCDPLFMGILCPFLVGFVIPFLPFICPFIICSGDESDSAELLSFFPYDGGYAVEHRRKTRNSEILVQFIQHLQSVTLIQDETSLFYHIKLNSKLNPNNWIEIPFDITDHHPHLDSLKQLVGTVNRKIHLYHNGPSSPTSCILDGVNLTNTNGYIRRNCFTGYRRDSGLTFQSPDITTYRRLPDLPSTISDLFPYERINRSCCPLFQLDWMNRGGFRNWNCPLIDTQCASWQDRRRFGDILFADDQRLIIVRDQPLLPGCITMNTNVCIINILSLGLFPLYAWYTSVADILIFWKSKNIETNQLQLNVSMIRKTFAEESILWTDYDIQDIVYHQTQMPLSPTTPYTFHLVYGPGTYHEPRDISNIPMKIRNFKWYYWTEQETNQFNGSPDAFVNMIKSYIPIKPTKVM